MSYYKLVIWFMFTISALFLCISCGLGGGGGGAENCNNNCYLKFYIYDTYGATIINYGVSAGQASEEEYNSLIRGRNVELSTIDGYGQYPIKNNPIHTLKVNCNKTQVIQSITINVQDFSCPSGVRTYKLMITIISPASTFKKRCSMDIVLYLRGDHSDFDSYCL